MKQILKQAKDNQINKGTEIQQTNKQTSKHTNNSIFQPNQPNNQADNQTNSKHDVLNLGSGNKSASC